MPDLSSNVESDALDGACWALNVFWKDRTLDSLSLYMTLRISQCTNTSGMMSMLYSSHIYWGILDGWMCMY